MLYDLLIAVWFVLPAGVANMAPVFAAKLPWLKNFNQPLDFNRQFTGKPIFGAHKTWRGLAAGIVAATLVLWLQQIIVANVNALNAINQTIDYQSWPILIVGPLFAIGALGGDAIFSFFKRRLDIKSGQSWIPFDQLDYVIGTVLIMLPFVILSWRQYLLIFVVWFLLHVGSTAIGYLLGLKKDPI